MALRAKLLKRTRHESELVLELLRRVALVCELRKQGTDLTDVSVDVLDLFIDLGQLRLRLGRRQHDFLCAVIPRCQLAPPV
jgi:hypothetical protein